MAKAKSIIIVSLMCLLLLGMFSWKGENAVAQAQDQERQTTIVVQFTQYEWWLIRWEDNAIVCRLFIDHEGLPTGDEVLAQCGQEIFDEWQATPPCEIITQGKESVSKCPGLYFHLASFQQREKEVVVNLPPPVVYVTLEGCMPTPPENRCPTIPSLRFNAEEPLPNERITAIQGFFGDRPFSCEGDVCILPLRPTSIEGVTVEFWAESSFGDTSEHFKALVRVVDTGVTDAPGAGGWYVDVVSRQWRGQDLASCVRIWQALPPLGSPPAWLASPGRSELISSSEPYFYLAGRLINQGLVDASSCATGGLLPNGYADACGLEKARNLVEAWQNQFDQRIVEVTAQKGIPAQLMKNLFAQESQFWPGVFRVPFEFGLGQLTDNGADTVLLWNNSFYDQFCPLVLSGEACQGGYLSLAADEKAMLRGALALQVRADCPECPTGIDLSNVHSSLSLFAETLQANCSQVGQIVSTASGQMPGQVASYEDLWRFTVANYHAGPGCVAFAIHSTWPASGGRLTWDQVSTRFTEACRGVVPYVEKITNIQPVNLVLITTPTATPAISPTPTAGPTPTASPTPGVSPTPGASPPPEAYPPPISPPQPSPYPGPYPPPQPTPEPSPYP